MIALKQSERETLFLGDGQELYNSLAIGTAHTLFFDPPWDIARSFDMGDSENILAFCDGYRAGDIIRLFGPPTWVFFWDCVSSWFTPNRPLRRGKICMWYGDINKYNPKGCLYGQPCGKPRMVTNSRGTYLFTPDEGKMLSDVFVKPITKLHQSGHNHGKPVEWVSMLIANTIRPGDVLIDPFAGGGSSLVACRDLGVSWVGAEIDADTASAILNMESRTKSSRPKQQRLF